MFETENHVFLGNQHGFPGLGGAHQIAPVVTYLRSIQCILALLFFLAENEKVIQKLHPSPRQIELAQFWEVEPSQPKKLALLKGFVRSKIAGNALLDRRPSARSRRLYVRSSALDTSSSSFVPPSPPHTTHSPAPTLLL
jgi:hypothetical protein